MPHHKSTAKRVKTNERDRKKNVAVKRQVRTAVRKLREGVKDENAPELLREAHSSLDNAERKGVMHRKTVDRNKSRLAKSIDRAKSASK